MLGDGLSDFASIFGTVARTGSQIGAAAITADATTSSAQDQADAASRVAVSRSTLDLALARLGAAQTARSSEALSFGLQAAGLVLALAVGLAVLA